MRHYLFSYYEDHFFLLEFFSEKGVTVLSFLVSHIKGLVKFKTLLARKNTSQLLSSGKSTG